MQSGRQAQPAPPRTWTSSSGGARPRRSWRWLNSGEELRERVRLADAAIVAGADDLPRRLHLSAVNGEEVAVEDPVAARAGGVRVRELDVAVVAVAKEELDG